MFTVAMVKTSRIPKILNVCPDDPALLEYCNEAQSRALSLPDTFWGTYQRAIFNVYDSFVVFPRGVVNIVRAKVCGTPMVMRNEFYAYLGPVGEPGYSEDVGCYLVLEADGTSPVYQNVTRTGNRVRAYPGHVSDVGKTLTVSGYDHNRVWVRTEDTTDPLNPIWIDGEKMVLSSPFTDSQTQWQEGGVTGVLRDQTNKNTALFEANFESQIEVQMADYQPDEIVPMYRKSRILNFRSISRGGCGTSNCADGPGQIDCIVKLGHIPVSQDQDTFVLQNMAALKDLAMSVKQEEDIGPGGGAASFRAGIALLREELKNFNGSRVTIKIDLHGGKQFGYMVRGMR